MGINQIAQNIQKERFQEGYKSKLIDTIAECALMQKYGIDIDRANEEQIGKYRHFVLKDKKNRKVSVFIHGSSIEVPVENLSTDVIVFSPRNTTFIFTGWLPVARIKECEQSYDERNNFRNTVILEVPYKALIPMPARFDFNVPCPCDGNKLWDNEYEAWECMNCGRIRPNEQQREKIRSINSTHTT